jgi:RNA polymerase-binding transcription factor DksA
MTRDYSEYKERLLAEQARLEEEMSGIAGRSTVNPADWEVSKPELDILPSDKNEVADQIEELVDNRAVLNELEAEHTAVLAALERIENGEYGVCETDGKEIPTARLDAYPAARTCVEHVMS